MLGTADIIAQMSDRCYLEKCRDRLYPEFVAGGLAHSGSGEVPSTAKFLSAEDLLRKTPDFYRIAQQRLTGQLDSASSTRLCTSVARIRTRRKSTRTSSLRGASRRKPTGCACCAARRLRSGCPA